MFAESSKTAIEMDNQVYDNKYPKPGQVHLTLESAISDSPLYRANLQIYEDDLEELAKWLDSSMKALRNSLETAASLNEEIKVSISGIVNTSMIKEYNFTKANFTLRTMHDALTSEHSCMSKLLKDLGAKLLFPISQLLIDDIKDIRETKKQYERMSEKYEATLTRYSTLSKLKEVSALREDAFQLYEIRKTYLHQSLDYTMALKKFKLSLDNFVVEKLLASMYSMLEFHQSSYEIFLSLKPHMEELKNSLHQRQSEVKNEISKLDDSRTSLEEEEKYKMMPDMPLTAAGREKSGYLFKKRQGKGLVPTWKRVYASISQGMFSFCSLGKHRGQIVQSEEMHVLLCEIRECESQDRRNCFEVYSTKKTFLLQTESEDELESWMQTFDNAKNYALSHDHHALPIHDSDAAKDKYNKSTDLSQELSKEPERVDDEGAKIINLKQQQEDDRTKSELPALITYNDPTYTKYNEELHKYVRNVPDTDVVLSALPCALQKETSIQGKLYLTQNRLCFYSNIFGIATSLLIGFKEVASIQRFEYTFYSSIKIITNDKSFFTFKTFLSDDTKILDAFNLLHQNEASSKPMSLQDLYNSLGLQKGKSASSPQLNSGTTTVFSLPSYEQYSSTKDKKIIPVPETTESPQAISSVGSETPDKSTPSTTSPYGDPQPYVAPQSMELPKTPVSCKCKEHYETTEIDSVYPFPAKFLFETLLMSTESNSVRSTLKDRRGLTHYRASEWIPPNQDEKGTYLLKQEAKYMIPITNVLLKGKETSCIETYKILKKDEHLCYVVDIAAKTPDAPFGDIFDVIVRYCITHVSRNSCRLRYSYTVIFSKSTLLKSIIKSSVNKNISLFIELLKNVLNEVITSIGATPLIEEEAGAKADTTNIYRKYKKIKVHIPFIHYDIELGEKWRLSILLEFLQRPYITFLLLLVLCLSLSMNFYQSRTSSTAHMEDELLFSLGSQQMMDVDWLGLESLNSEFKFLDRVSLSFTQLRQLEVFDEDENNKGWLELVTNPKSFIATLESESVLGDILFQSGDFKRNNKTSLDWFVLDHGLNDKHYENLQKLSYALRRRLSYILKRILSIDQRLYLLRHINYLMDELYGCYETQKSLKCQDIEKSVEKFMNTYK